MNTTLQHAVASYLRGAETDVHGIAGAMGCRVEDASAAIAALDAKGIVEFICGNWRLTSRAMDSRAPAHLPLTKAHTEA